MRGFARVFVVWLVGSVGVGCASFPDLPGGSRGESARSGDPDSLPDRSATALEAPLEQRLLACGDPDSTLGEAHAVMCIDAELELARRGGPRAVDWRAMSARLERLLDRSPEPADVDRLVFLQIFASIRANEARFEIDPAPELDASRALVARLVDRNPTSPYLPAALMTVAEREFEAGRYTRALEHFERATMLPAAGPRFALRARYRYAYVRFVAVAHETRMQSADPVRLENLVVVLDEHLRELRSVREAASHVDDPVMLDAASRMAADATRVVLEATVSSDEGLAGLASSLGLADSERSRVARVVAASLADESPALALQVLRAWHGFASLAGECDRASDAVVGRLICGLRAALSDEELAYLEACGLGTPFACTPDARADLNALRRALRPARQAIAHCLAGHRRGRRPPTPTVVRVAPGPDGAPVFTWVHTSDDARAQTCAAAALARLTTPEVLPRVVDPVEMALWSDGRGGAVAPLDEGGAIVLNELAVEGSGPSERGVMSITIDDDVFARPTATVP